MPKTITHPLDKKVLLQELLSQTYLPPLRGLRRRKVNIFETTIRNCEDTADSIYSTNLELFPNQYKDTRPRPCNLGIFRGSIALLCEWEK